MSIKVMPDWHKLGTKLTLEKDIGVNITGPGFYLFKDDTMLVVREYEEINFNQSPNNSDTIYRVYVYNVPIHKTIFGLNDTIPTRLDER